MASEKIGRYIIKSELGRGGMATVYHAYDPNFERDVAIKVLPAAFLHDPQFRVRFEREAKMIALLEHPAIVPVYDFGEQEGQPYIVMRYMSGGSLADRLSQGAIPFEETSRIIARLAPALDVAHARGIIHRDIKPGNVLFDQYGNAFLSDFGIARLTQQAATTITGESIVGTPAYMSPEQVQGTKTIDGRSDIYAMGVLVYQMLTGHIPYQADTPAKIMLMHILEPVPCISDERADLPLGSEDIISRAMAKDPTDRYATTAELASSMEVVVRNPKSPAQAQRAAPIDQTIVSGATVVASPKTPAPVRGAPMRGAPASDTSTLPAGARIPVQAVTAAPPLPRRSFTLPIALMAILLLGGAAVGAFLIFGRQGNALALLGGGQATATVAPRLEASVTPLPPSETPAPKATASVPVAVVATPTAAEPTAASTSTTAPTETPTPLPVGPVIGGADMIAFLNGSNVWVANLDGSQLKQLTSDGTSKTSLQWTPDGQALTYVSGKCVQMVSLESATVENLACLNYIDSLTSFDISPDGSRAAITVDKQMYIVPFDTARLKEVETRGDLVEMAECKDFAPYAKNLITQVRWSKDSTTLAAKLIANMGGGKQGNIVQLFRVDFCAPNPRAEDNFPPPRFTMPGFDKKPVIQNYAWDGTILFALNNIVRNEGFGDLYLYNSDLHKAYEKVNPVGNVCCYRDPHFSPDGTYLLFAFQNYMEGSSSQTQIFYIPYASIGSSATYDPLPLPPITDPREAPWPVLRPVQGG
jgi:serine/threonine-protein kinase